MAVHFICSSSAAWFRRGSSDVRKLLFRRNCFISSSGKPSLGTVLISRNGNFVAAMNGLLPNVSCHLQMKLCYYINWPKPCTISLSIYNIYMASHTMPCIAPLSCLLLLLSSFSQCQAQLSPTFYDKTCPNALNIIRTAVRQAVSTECRMAASLVRLHFHDCFVQGCDAYLIRRRVAMLILLDESPTIKSEKTALPNLGSARGYDVIEAAKGELEKACPGIVSCADVLSLAARDATVAVGGPSWTVKLGRRNSTMASRTIDLPSPFDNLDRLISNFVSKGLNTRDLVALSGAHTLGQAQCFLFHDRIYGNGTDIDADFANTRRRNCPKDTGNGNLAPLDLVTPNSFDNNYYKNLLQKKGLLQSDQVLFSGGATDNIVSEYARSPQAFQTDFASAMIKMSEIQPLTGQNGIIRKVCGGLN
ncbi:lignin-forming anionic peroxidase-like [Ipomoea triloba]|uniref:lignin-forming anionic peroxidase-like n=1 Tax=Ipomoea triloba TaxID=35885 RepID=UPI00125D4020|nr:lignin-forming anionic peroxidase-like [Ipomoea triloba]